MTPFIILLVVLVLLGLYFAPRTDNGLLWILWMALEATLVIVACLASQGWTWRW